MQWRVRVKWGMRELLLPINFLQKVSAGLPEPALLPPYICRQTNNQVALLGYISTRMVESSGLRTQTQYQRKRRRA
jgi:hypothetical protein